MIVQFDILTFLFVSCIETHGQVYCAHINQAKEQKALLFNPLLLPAGIEPSEDPVLLIRPAAYAVSFGQRAQ